MISADYLKQVRLLWNEYILNHRQFDEKLSILRPIIAESWKRCQKFGVSPTSMQDTEVPYEAFVHIQKENNDLIRIALPYLEQLYEYMRGTNYMIQLCDMNSCVLKCLSNNDLVGQLVANISIQKEGYLVSEEKIGTNSTGLCQHLKIPVQVFGEEHFQARNHNFTCTSAPILDDEQNMIGILTLMCTKEFHQLHTLGMVSIASDGIRKELSLKRSYDKLILTNSVLSSTIESIASGIMLIDENKNISLHNQNVLKILKLPASSIAGKSIYQFIRRNSIPAELQTLDTAVNETELTVTNYLGKKADIVLKITIILDDDGNRKASLLSFMTQKQLHKLSNKVTSFHATYTFDSISGSSNAIKSVISMGRIAASSDSPTLILGESGTGKELVAQSIHNASSRSGGPFLSLNCGAIPKNLIASELFGSEYGAFTGASKAGNPGKFELASGGTLFLDEIGDMPFDLQVSLLRVLQNKEIIRLGGNSPKKIDVRIIAATNKNLMKAITDNTFRADLYYRLNVLNITIPPLRDRPEDIPILAFEFMKQYAKSLDKPINSISEDAISKLLNYTWPGNVRELENVIERAANVTDTNIIDTCDLPQELTSPRQDALLQLSAAVSNTIHRPTGILNTSTGGTSPEFVEYQMLRSLLEQERGHVKTAAKQAGMPLSTFYSKLKKYSLDPRNFRKW